VAKTRKRRIKNPPYGSFCKPSFVTGLGASVKHSIRDAKAQLAEAAAAQSTGGMDFERAATFRRALGIDGLTVGLPADFDDPVFSR
jgi:hypothetical protein